MNGGAKGGMVGNGAEDPLKPAWFCIRSQPKREHIAASHLEREAGMDVFLPRIRFKRPTRQGLAWVTEALFPNYLFVRFIWQLDCRRVRHARGVAGIVHFGNRWPTIPDWVLADLQQQLGPESIHTIPTLVQPGDAVEVIAGAFRGLQAVVTHVLPARERVRVLLEFLGRQTSVEMPMQAVLKEEDVRDGLF